MELTLLIEVNMLCQILSCILLHFIHFQTYLRYCSGTYMCEFARRIKDKIRQTYNQYPIVKVHLLSSAYQ